MKYYNQTIRLLYLFVLIFTVSAANAQQNKLDSLIVLINKSHTEKGVDTTAFFAAFDSVNFPALNDQAISEIETAAGKLNNGKDEYFSYLTKYEILYILMQTDPYKCIEYGKQQVAQLEKKQGFGADAVRTSFLTTMRFPYRNTDKLPDGFRYYTDKLSQYKLANDSMGIFQSYFVLSGFFNIKGLKSQGIYNMKKSLLYADTLPEHDRHYGFFSKNNGRSFWLNNLAVLGDLYLENGNLDEGLKYSRLALKYYLDAKDTENISFIALNIADTKLQIGQLDSVPYYLQLANKATLGVEEYEARLLLSEANYNIKLGRLDTAEKMLMQSWQLIRKNNISIRPGSGTFDPDYYLALVRIQQKKYTEAISLLNADIIRLGNIRLDKLRDFHLLAGLYENTGNIASANETNKQYIQLQDSLFKDQLRYGNMSFETEQQMSEKELAITRLESDNKLSTLSRNFILGIAALLLLLTGLIYFRFKSKQKANTLLEQALSDLKQTQAQLIQSEKMASLGELTAGIAHEIQNPLNFVNNFSEVSNEMIDEMKEELAIGNLQLATEIADDIKQNLEKINHHGKRADAIVKNMLQHSRQTKSIKELTNINGLCDEYLRLAYHGLRAKDKEFNADFKTDFDASIGKINIVPQDIGRVLLNLINNAFYATNEKLKAHGSQLEADYKPLVSVQTKKLNNNIEIKVSDNGNGIPQNIVDKIFQPFFTTKPTGQGTGLGLSLSYDIIKAHSGQIKVESKEGEGTTFIIQLPVV